MGDAYEQWLRAKMATAAPSGMEPAPLPDHLYPHQRDLVQWSLRRGRAAVFADTGLGKTAIQLEWARQVAEREGRVLIVAPLAVADQTVREGERFGVPVEYARNQGGTDAPIVITNYQMLDRFTPAEFAGVVLDESSILKAHDGKTRNAIIASCASTPYRLACTATPAPNDFMELGNHSEFLGVKTRQEMLAEFFVHDGGETQKWRLKGHAEDPFWRWMCSWAAMVRKPSDLGHDDGGFSLPPLRYEEHIVDVDHSDAWSSGYLFAPQATKLSDQRAVRRMTETQRVEQAAAIADCDEPVIVWCELNGEADAVEAAIPDAVQVRGADDLETKRERLLGFAEGRYRVLVTKASIAGFGMNWQHCARVVFVGASHSFEQTYQAIRRCWRFGQKRPVTVHIIRAETEGAIVKNLRRKEADAARMADAMTAHMRDVHELGARAAEREWDDYQPAVPMQVPAWVGEDAA